MNEDRFFLLFEDSHQLDPPYLGEMTGFEPAHENRSASEIHLTLVSNISTIFYLSRGNR